MGLELNDGVPASGGGGVSSTPAPIEPSTIGEALKQNAMGPKRSKDGTFEMEQHSIADQIAADNHLASKSVACNPFAALRFTKLIPPGAG